MQGRRQRLASRFRQQEEFSTGYAPLYARLFGILAGWLEDEGSADDPLVQWLLDAAEHRRTLDVTLLLAAGLHRDILGGQAGLTGLARYYPTAGGTADFTEPAFELALRHAILNRRDDLAAFIKDGQVQTNETGRGLCWLLPLLSTGWDSVCLVDLGASAGLNLVAEQRSYRLVEDDTEKILLDLGTGHLGTGQPGTGQPLQFITRCHGEIAPLKRLNPSSLPVVNGRIGGDLSPFRLETKADERTLMSFVWGDQPQRLERLREGLEVFRLNQATDAPVSLFEVDLPDGLAAFLWDRVPAEPSSPVLIFNTFMTTYLHDKGQSMGFHIDQWAFEQNRPVLWLQWEPPGDLNSAPHLGWCAWTADLWRGNQRRHWHLGWVHPHGTEAKFGPGLADWISWAKSLSI